MELMVIPKLKLINFSFINPSSIVPLLPYSIPKLRRGKLLSAFLIGKPTPKVMPYSVQLVLFTTIYEVLYRVPIL